MRKRPAPAQPHADDDDWVVDDEEASEAAVLPHAQGNTGVDVLAELLLEMTAAVTKLYVLLQEADEDEFKLVKPRLKAFHALVGELPENGKPQRRVGFRLERKRRK